MHLRFKLAGAVAGASVASTLALAAAPPPPPSLDPEARAVMQLPAPPAQRYRARDGAELAYRAFTPATDGPAPVVAVLVHGSAGSSLNMTALGGALAGAGVPAFAPDIRGQGLSGRRGDIDYVGQLEDDLADFLKVVRARYPTARLALVGHSSGGGFALRVAGEPLGRAFDRFVLVAPVLGRLAPSTNASAGWARPDLPKILMLSGLNRLGVTAFNGERVIAFNLPPDTAGLGLTRGWSYRMADNFGPHGQMQLFGEPAYRCDAARAAAPVTVVAGSADALFYADRYAEAFQGLARPPNVQIAPGVSHMGAVSDPRAVRLIVAAVQAAGG
jgi:alpha-beta hydrolase superfamily lysophospholipase